MYIWDIVYSNSSSTQQNEIPVVHTLMFSLVMDSDTGNTFLGHNLSIGKTNFTSRIVTWVYDRSVYWQKTWMKTESRNLLGITVITDEESFKEFLTTLLKTEWYFWDITV